MKKVNFIKVAEVILAAVIIAAPLSAAFAIGVDSSYCNSAFQNCNAGNTVGGLIRTVINWLLGIAFGVAILFLIIGGFWYITSAGNEETAEKGKGTAINAIIGIIIIILSYVIVNVVANLVGNSNSTTGP
jgi:hypothetical protein